MFSKLFDRTKRVQESPDTLKSAIGGAWGSAGGDIEPLPQNQWPEALANYFEDSPEYEGLPEEEKEKWRNLSYSAKLKLCREVTG